MQIITCYNAMALHSLFECLFTVKEALIIIKNVNTFLLVLISQYNGM